MTVAPPSHERTDVSLHRTRLALFALAVLALGAQNACDTTPTQPATPTPLLGAPPLRTLTGGASGTVIGPWGIPIPSTNTVDEGFLPWTLTGLKLPSFTAYVVKVEGRVNVSSNPAVVACFPDHPPPYGAEGSYGPMGNGYYDQLRVSTSFATAGYWDYVPLYGAYAGPDGGSEVFSDTLFAWNDGEVVVFRKGILSGIGNGICGAGFYSFSSGQSITVTKLDGQELTISPRQVLVKKGTVVRFTARTSDGTVISTPNWRFVPAPGFVKVETGDCGISGPNPCDLTINNDGEYRVSRYVNGRMRGDGATVRIYSTFELLADKASIEKDEVVAFTPMIDGKPGDALRWLWRAEDKSEVAEPCPVTVDHKCHYAPASSGTMWAYTSTQDGGDSASAHVQVGPVPPPDECGTALSRSDSGATSAKGAWKSSGGAVQAKCDEEPPAKLLVTGPATFNPAGPPVTFTASAPGATTLSINSWAFHVQAKPVAGGARRSQSTADPMPAVPCGIDVTCTITPDGAGYVVVYAVVDGEAQTDSTYTAPQPNHLTLSASATSVENGTSVRFTAGTEYLPAKVVVSGWEFTGDDGWVSSGPGCNRPSTAMACDEALGRSGTMTVFATVNGEAQTAAVHVDVTITLVIRFDAHAPSFMPSVYPYPAEPKSACSTKMITSIENSWGLTVLDGEGAGAKRVANMTLTLELGAVDESGGHLSHSGARPLGSLVAGPTHVTTRTVTTDARGRVRFSYFSPEFGGRNFVRAEARGVVKADSFFVGMPLAEMDGEGRDWQAWGIGRDKHRDVYFASPNMRAAALTLAKDFTVRFPGRQLYFNDMGLQTGGRLDVLGTWDASVDHCSHRFGNALDLRTNDMTPKEFKWVGERWAVITATTEPLYHREHYHLQTKREF